MPQPGDWKAMTHMRRQQSTKSDRLERVVLLASVVAVQLTLVQVLRPAQDRLWRPYSSREPRYSGQIHPGQCLPHEQLIVNLQKPSILKKLYLSMI
ncbi:hypothetical protein D3C87_1576600 [compost metagenome]